MTGYNGENCMPVARRDEGPWVALAVNSVLLGNGDSRHAVLCSSPAPSQMRRSQHKQLAASKHTTIFMHTRLHHEHVPVTMLLQLATLEPTSSKQLW
jgi:hypothetical protein